MIISVFPVRRVRLSISPFHQSQCGGYQWFYLHPMLTLPLGNLTGEWLTVEAHCLFVTGNHGWVD